MKKVILIFSLLFQVTAFAQLEDWYKVDLSRIGYKNTTFTFENLAITANGVETGEFSQIKINGGSFELSSDIFTKYMYFSIDMSTFLDVGLTLFQFDKSKQRWWNNDEYFVLRSDVLPVRLAFGHTIGKYVGFYVGGQYSLSSVGIQYKNNIPLRDTYIGGHTYGAGGHVVSAYKYFHARYSYMYNWQSRGGYFTGNGITNEFVLSVGYADFGVFTKFTHIYNMNNGGYLPKDRTRLFKSGNEGQDFTWQSAHFATQFQFSIGIYAAGLLSGVTKAGTETISKTEKGLAKERREEKRRKVEYKD